MFDNVCKFIAANFSQDLTTWLLGKPIPLTVLEPTELYVDPIRADSLIFLQSEDIVVHVEFQTDPKNDVPSAWQITISGLPSVFRGRKFTKW